MPWHSLNHVLRRLPPSQGNALEKYMNAPVVPLDLRRLSHKKITFIPFGIQQLAARTARCYMSFHTELPDLELPTQTQHKIEHLKHLCSQEFEYCVALQHLLPAWMAEMADREWAHEDRRVEIPQCNVGFDMPLVEALEVLRPRESMLDYLTNEITVNSLELNSWISCFCRRRVVWRVIQEHCLHILNPSRYPSVVRVDESMEKVLHHTASIVAELHVNAIDCAGDEGELIIEVTESPQLLTSCSLHLTNTSSLLMPPCITLEALATASPSAAIYSMEGHLEYVFRELIKNASVAALRSGGPLAVSVKYWNDSSRVIVEVTDWASGITAEMIERIWYFGWTESDVKSLMSGCGVGLPTSKVYMDICGGVIDVHTAPGRGTTMRVTFPKAVTEVLLDVDAHPPL